LLSVALFFASEQAKVLLFSHTTADMMLLSVLLVAPIIKSQLIYYDDLIHTAISTSLLCRQTIGVPVGAASSVVDGSTQKIFFAATAASNLGLGQ